MSGLLIADFRSSHSELLIANFPLGTAVGLFTPWKTVFLSFPSLENWVQTHLCLWVTLKIEESEVEIRWGGRWRRRQVSYTDIGDKNNRKSICNTLQLLLPCITILSSLPSFPPSSASSEFKAYISQATFCIRWTELQFMNVYAYKICLSEKALPHSSWFSVKLQASSWGTSGLAMLASKKMDKDFKILNSSLIWIKIQPREKFN